jgi:hypothetical protein
VRFKLLAPYVQLVRRLVGKRRVRDGSFGIECRNENADEWRDRLIGLFGLKIGEVNSRIQASSEL